MPIPNEAQIRHNVLNKYRTDQVRGTKFDGDSIMLYFFPGSWTKSGQATKANETLSELDRAFIASRHIQKLRSKRPSLK